MNHKLFEKYGNYNCDGIFIIDHEKWHYYAQNPQLYRRKMIIMCIMAFLPFVGIIAVSIIADEMGLDAFSI